ncbi:helix-turn-helix domain-containing protein [Gillisia sp. JM1]|uniref:helix-turn-helix domain-containing protein n=1 Tax=Gillisia sp. JM1 TaxID=1283286 RepID=UPI000419BAF3|nr:helix-turn-helix domain-containing protein [Gillisia sp. JM1]
MYYPDDKQFDQITRLITALANGQYDKRIKVTKLDNKFSTISVLLNMLAGVLKEAVPGLYPENNLSYLNHIILLIGKDLNIYEYNYGALELFREEHLKHLNYILDNSSIQKLKEMIISNAIENSVSLNFRLKDDLFLTMNSRLTRFKNQNINHYILSAVKTISKNEWSREELLQNSILPRSQFNISKNKQLIDRLYHYLMDNLDSPLKPIPEIADDLNTNATLLKRGFKIIHSSTIAKFHRDKRLERAKDLLLDNDTPLIVIADQCGFKSISHFSRAFKKHFGINPSKSR